MFPQFERDGQRPFFFFCQLHLEIHCLFILIMFQLEAEARDSRGEQREKLRLLGAFPGHAGVAG